MALLDELVAEIGDTSLRRKIEASLADMKRRQRFGLVFEEHVPETAAVYGLPVQVGCLVQRRDDPAGKELFRVLGVASDGHATLEPADGGSHETVATDCLLAVKQFGEPIYPALTPLGSVCCGPEHKPHHAAINGENYHALQLLLYLYEGRVDCIYIDPPYNTGARDWKYNNHYVDQNDVWRHSKWLSFMEKRLRFAKRLLKDDGILIVTVDENEVHHLGMLLEKLYADAYRQMITIVINPKGVRQERFSRVEEYAFFCFLGKAGIIGREDDMLSPGIDNEEAAFGNDETRRPRWNALLRSGTNARRQDRPKMFYPVLIDVGRGAVVGTGEPLPLEQDPAFDTEVNGCTAVWPIRSDGSLGRWGVGHVALRQLIARGYVALGQYQPSRGTWAISYLGKDSRDQLASGMLEAVSYDEVRNVVDVRYADVASRRMKTVWHRSRHDAGVGGTDLIRAIFGTRAFSFPKSVYAVYDCLAAVVGDRKNALILDFFAGSGTTLHATALLNAGDDGQRRCILVTNNEVEAMVSTQLSRQGFFPGDPVYEASGIFEQVTRVRCEGIITGVRPDGSPIPGAHLDGRPFRDGFPENVEFYRLDYLDPDDLDLGRQFEAIHPSLWLAAGGVGTRETRSQGQDFIIPAGSTYGVLFKESRFRQFLDALGERPDVTHVWLVTDSEEAYAEMGSALPHHLCRSMLYRDYLRNFRINIEHAR